jgi:hypothetical protein
VQWVLLWDSELVVDGSNLCTGSQAFFNLDTNKVLFASLWFFSGVSKNFCCAPIVQP